MSQTHDDAPPRGRDTRPIARAATFVAIAMSVYHLWVLVPPIDALSPLWRMIFPGPPADYIFRSVHLLFALSVAYLYYSARAPSDDELILKGETRSASAMRPLDMLFFAMAIVPLLYVFWSYDYFVNRIIYVDDLTPVDMAMAVSLLIALLEATRRTLGWPLPVTALCFLAYTLLVVRVEPMRLLDQLYMSTEGVFGPTLAVSASYVVIFVLFGSFMERTGSGQLFMDLALSAAGGGAGGPGKVAVISSSLFGSISGSAVANVMVTGSVTIPLMKRTGFAPRFAGAVEAVASTGGQIMPPIMGAAAFVMAEFMGVTYGQVVIWAIIPALLFYLACFAAVHFEAKRQGLEGVPRDQLPKFTQTMRERGHLLIPVFGILFMMYSGYSAPLCAFIGTILCFPVAALRKSTRHMATWANFLDALADGARNAVPVALACATAGIIIGSITLTGLGIVFTQLVTHVAQNTLLLALILTMLAGAILGMGMPTTPAYIIMTSLLVPALIKLGVVTPAAHMFAFYFAILSAITPPVALAVYAAAGIARSDLWGTGWAAVKVGAAGFIVPFMFVYEPGLLMIGDWSNIIHVCITASFGVVIFASGLHGYWIARSARWESAILIAAGLGLVTPGALTDVLGVAAAALVTALQWARRKRERAVAAHR